MFLLFNSFFARYLERTLKFNYIINFIKFTLQIHNYEVNFN